MTRPLLRSMGALRRAGGLACALACIAAGGCRYESHVATSAPTAPATIALTEQGDVVGALAWADLDGDGIDDLAIVDLLPTEAAAEARPRVRLYHGRSERPSSLLAFDAALLGPSFVTVDGAFRPTGVELSASAGDFDGDGTEDLAVGVAFEASGALYVVYGGDRLEGERDLAASATVLSRDDVALGSSVRSLLDIDGDGADELVLHSHRERAWLVPGDRSRDLAIAYELEGASIFPLGDVDGDTNADVAVRRGRTIEVHLGPLVPTRLGGAADLELAADEAELEGVIGLDLDADGQNELVAHGPDGADSVLVVFSVDALEPTVEAVVRMPGAIVMDAGDSSGDGRADPIVGCARTLCDDAERCRGRAYRFLDVRSAASHEDATHAWTGEEGALVFEGLGTYVAADGDFDGDGHADAVLSGPYGPVRLIYGERQEQ